MSDAAVSQRPCYYCRCLQHLGCCPHDDATAILIWSSGRAEALKDNAVNIHADCPIFTLGFRIGEEERRRMLEIGDGRLTPEKTDEMFPEEAPEPRPSRPLPSVTELELVLGERREAPSVPPKSAGAQAFDAGRREVATRENDLF